MSPYFKALLNMANSMVRHKTKITTTTWQQNIHMERTKESQKKTYDRQLKK